MAALTEILRLITGKWYSASTKIELDFDQIVHMKMGGNVRVKFGDGIAKECHYDISIYPGGLNRFSYCLIINMLVKTVEYHIKGVSEKELKLLDLVNYEKEGEVLILKRISQPPEEISGSEFY